MDHEYDKYFVTEKGGVGLAGVRRDALQLVKLLDSIKTKTRMKNVLMARNALQRKRKKPVAKKRPVKNRTTKNQQLLLSK